MFLNFGQARQTTWGKQMSLFWKVFLTILWLTVGALVVDGIYTAYVICCYESPSTREIREIIENVDAIEERKTSSPQP